MKVKQVFLTALISGLTTLGVIWGYGKFSSTPDSYGGQPTQTLPANYKLTGFSDGSGPGGAPDFVQASNAAIPTVVHIKTKTNAKQVNNGLPRTQRQNPFSDFFGDDMFEEFFGKRNNVIPEQRASGSGVIIADNGYIVTNNHVVQNADEITVTLSNKKTYTAKVIGTEPAYDLAVIKVEASGLPYLVYGNSDEVKIGQWVLAIGYPLNLETTVTAGIVSAKARSLGLNKDRNGSRQNAVESFIQTDAAVNQGNSGGALINSDGRLIGINSAIASYTGFYTGYSYAIPVNIVKKVVDDIIKYGTVQRGYLGVQFSDASDMTAAQKKQAGIPENAWGIYVQEATADGGAAAAGIRKGDIIKSINGVAVQSGAELQEQISRFKPGDKVTLVYIRNDKENSTVVTLKNKVGNYDVVKAQTSVDLLGADLASLDNKKAKEFGVDGGVVVKKVKDGGAIFNQTRMKDGFVILKVNDKVVKSVDELHSIIGNAKSVTISGFYPGYDGLYEYPLSLDGSDNEE